MFTSTQLSALIQEASTRSYSGGEVAPDMTPDELATAYARVDDAYNKGEISADVRLWFRSSIAYRGYNSSANIVKLSVTLFLSQLV